MKVSIIIPTYNRADLLKTCLDSLKENTDLSDKEVIVVSNGCVDSTVELVPQYGTPFKLIHRPQRLGYAKAINAGLVLAKGEYIVLLNNDTRFFASEINWVDLLLEPFRLYKNVGLVGPQFFPHQYANTPCLFFFCVMLSRQVFDAVGFLDERFGIGGNEDLDYCIRAYRAGFTIHKTVYEFPIFHAGGLTRAQLPDVREENNEIFRRKYGKNSINVN